MWVCQQRDVSQDNRNRQLAPQVALAEPLIWKLFELILPRQPGGNRPEW